MSSKQINCRYLVVISLSLSLSLIIAPLAWAGYRPPKTPSAPKRSGTNITRSGSCSANATGKLTVLAPLSHVGQTTSTHPTFAWFVPEATSYPLEFRLFLNKQRLYRTEMQSKPGIMQFSLPSNQNGLIIGQSYIWQLVLICNPNSPSSNILAAAEIEVVKSGSALQRQLAQLPNPQQRVNLYAQNGLWFDAIAAALQTSAKLSNPAIVVGLLNSLADVEARSSLKDWSDQLRQVGAITQKN